MPENPCPPERITLPPTYVSIASQCANDSVIRANDGASASLKLPSVSFENTTPQPNVSSARLRSNTSISCAGSDFLSSRLKYSPAGPPPMTAIFTPRW
jgi:hypothetical protein